MDNIIDVDYTNDNINIEPKNGDVVISELQFRFEKLFGGNKMKKWSVIIWKI